MGHDEEIATVLRRSYDHRSWGHVDIRIEQIGYSVDLHGHWILFSGTIDGRIAGLDEDYVNVIVIGELACYASSHRVIPDYEDAVTPGPRMPTIAMGRGRLRRRILSTRSHHYQQDVADRYA